MNWRETGRFGCKNLPALLMPLDAVKPRISPLQFGPLQVPKCRQLKATRYGGHTLLSEWTTMPLPGLLLPIMSQPTHEVSYCTRTSYILPTPLRLTFLYKLQHFSRYSIVAVNGEGSSRRYTKRSTCIRLGSSSKLSSW